MGLWEKLLGKAASAVNITLADRAQQKGVTVHDGLCAVCMGWMKWPELPIVYPVPVRTQRQKPQRSALDLGGWCPRCNRILCPNELDWVQFNFKEQDWWMPGCRECNVPVGGKRRRTERQGAL